MTAKPVNLRQYRKKKARSEKEKRAAENRVAFGTPKALTALEKARAELERKKAEAAKIEQDKSDPSPSS